MLLIILLTIVLLLLLILLGFCFWHIFAPVPFVPTSAVMVKKMIQIAELQPSDIVYDLGAGDARILIAAKKDCEQCTAIGYEFLPSAYLQGRLAIWWNNVHVTLFRGSFFRANFANATVIFTYLFPNVMVALEKKFENELKPGTKIISHAFQFAQRTPVASYAIQDGRKVRDIYVYIW